jgi:ketosteroid isomerase-like protein
MPTGAWGVGQAVTKPTALGMSLPQRDTERAMSEENVEIVRRDIAARSARDWAVLAKIWHPDIELEVTAEAGVVAGAGTFRGFEEIRRFFEGLSNLYSEYRVEANEIIEAGDRVVTVEQIAGRGLKGSSAANWVHEDLFRLITFREGKVWRVKEYANRAQALEAAGLRE